MSKLTFVTVANNASSVNASTASSTHPEPARMVRIRRHPLQPVQQSLLQRLHVGVLAADTHLDACRTFGRLFTLVAEHSPFSTVYECFTQP